MTRAMNLDALEAQSMDANGWTECHLEKLLVVIPFKMFMLKLLGFASYILKILRRKYGAHMSHVQNRMGYSYICGCLNTLEQIEQDLISNQRSLGPANANKKTNPNNNTPHTFSTFLCLCHSLQPPTKTTELDT